MNKLIRIIFCGTPEFAVPFLKSVAGDADFEIVSVITQPDKPTGRKQILTPPPVKILAQKNNFRIFQPESLKNNPELVESLKSISPDLIIVVAFGQLIPKEILAIPARGSINVHPSLLPKYRGASPVQSAILNGDKNTGITIMLMDEKMDHGPILAQKELALSGDETNESLHQTMAKIGSKLLLETAKSFLEESIQPQEQNHDLAVFCRPITRNDAKIDWRDPAEKIERKIRAFQPWPGTWTILSDKRLKIFPPAIVIKDKNNEKLEAGKIMAENKKIIVACGEDYLEIKKMQIEGKKEISADDFLRGQKLSDAFFSE